MVKVSSAVSTRDLTNARYGIGVTITLKLKLLVSTKRAKANAWRNLWYA